MRRGMRSPAPSPSRASGSSVARQPCSTVTINASASTASWRRGVAQRPFSPAMRGAAPAPRARADRPGAATACAPRRCRGVSVSCSTRWSRTSSSSKGRCASSQPRASSSRRMRQPSMASSSSPGLTPALSATPPRSTDFTCTPLNGPSLRRRPSSSARLPGSRRSCTPKSASSGSSGSSSVPCTHSRSCASHDCPATLHSAARMSASSIAPPAADCHSRRITSSRQPAELLRRCRSSASATRLPLV